MPRLNWRVRTVLFAAVCSAVFLRGCGDPAAQLVQAIRNPRDRYAIDEAIAAVNRWGRGNAAAARLIGLIKEKSAVRGRAVRALGEITADANLVVPALIEAREDDAIRARVTESLGEIGSVDDRVVPALVLSLKDEGPTVRRAAVYAFIKIGPAGAAAVPALIELLDDRGIASEVAQALGRMGPKAKSASLSLIGLLKTAKGYERLHAAEALWLIDQNIDEAVPALIESLKDPYLPIRRDAADALGRIGPRAGAAVPALIAARDYTPEPRPRREAHQQNGETAIIVEVPEEEFYPVVREAAVAALSKIERGR